MARRVHITIDVAGIKRTTRAFKRFGALLHDYAIEGMGLVERVEQGMLVDDGVATTAEIYEGLALDEDNR